MSNLKYQKAILVSSLSLVCLFGIASIFHRPKSQVLVDFELNQVHVVVSAKRILGDQIEFTARFDPQPNFSLYAFSLPESGISGLGRPTRFFVYSNSLREQGELIEHPTAHYKTYPELKVRLPMYKAGRVELVRNFRLVNSKKPDTTEFVFSYMSCNPTGGCTIPVTNKKVEVNMSETLPN